MVISAPPTGPEVRYLEVYSPVDGRFVGRWPAAGRSAVNAAVAGARVAAGRWARTAAARRGLLLRQAAAALRERSDELAGRNHEETGRPVAQAREGVLAGAGTLEQYAELGPAHRGRSLLGEWGATDLMVPEPRGVVAALTPWNDPVAVACGLLGAALVTGNAVLHKPSERCPGTGLLLTETLAGALPDGVLQCLTGAADIGGYVAAHREIDVVAHVGSTETGRSIAAATAITGAKALLENGGNDALIVDGDVDPVWAAREAAVGAFANTGQICTSVERIFCHGAVAESFVEELVRQARLRVPQPRDGEIVMGPLVDTRLREAVHRQVTGAVADGATVRVGGEIPDGPGAYYPATVLTGCTPSMRVMREETFGPVAPVTAVEGFDEALAAAVADHYGLAATVLTGSPRHAQRAWRELPVGTVKVNAVFGGAPAGAAQPRGTSGTGFGYGPELLDEMTAMKVVHIEPSPACERLRSP